MKARWISLGGVIGLVLVLTFASASASGRSVPSTGVAGTSVVGHSSDRWAAMDAMHDSPAMEQMHGQMPEELQQRCDAMHERMDQMMGSSMTGGPGTAGFTRDGMMGSNGAGAGMMGW